DIAHPPRVERLEPRHPTFVVPRNSIRTGDALVRGEAAQRLGQQLEAAMQPPIHRRALNMKYMGSFQGPQALTTHQVKRFAFLCKSVPDRCVADRVDAQRGGMQRANNRSCPAVTTKLTRIRSPPLPWGKTA